MHGPVDPGIVPALCFWLVIGTLPWVIPARCETLAAAFMLVAVALVAPLGTWAIGPTLGMGALMVLVPVSATFLFGRRLAIFAALYTALVLAGVGLVSWLVGRPGVGLVPGAQIPYPVYARVAFTTIGIGAIALVLTDAALGAAERALREAREAAARERVEAERRRTAELALARAQRLEAIGQLASGVAHDTRNALLVMRSAMDELRELALPPDPAEALRDLEHAVAGITVTMHQLLALSAHGAGRASGASPVDPGAVVRHFASALRRILPEVVTLSVETAATTPVVLQPTLFEQALLNLALNARDAMPAGGALSLRVREERRGAAPRVVVEVVDTGVGMDPGTAARMFEPFFTTKPDGQGTGLGLAMVQGFVASAAGRIEVESTPGAGTCVRLCFPAAATGLQPQPAA